MKKIISYTFSLIFLVLGLYFSYDISGTEKIFVMGGVIIGTLVVRWMVQKILDQITGL